MLCASFNVQMGHDPDWLGLGIFFDDFWHGDIVPAMLNLDAIYLPRRCVSRPPGQAQEYKLT